MTLCVKSIDKMFKKIFNLKGKYGNFLHRQFYPFSTRLYPFASKFKL